MSDERSHSAFALTDALRRRWWLASGLFLWTLAATAGVVLSLPNLYRATATVLVQRDAESGSSQSPAEVTAALETRMQTISQEMLSRTRLESLLRHFDLYPDVRRQEGFEAAVNRLRADIKIEPKDAGSDGRPETVAFTVSFANADALLAALVANNLAGSYLEENRHIRNGQAHSAAELLKTQLDEAKTRLDAQDRQASALRQQYSGELPEQTTANLAAIERLSTELRLNGDRQQRAIDRREQLLRDPAAASRPSTAATEPASTSKRLAELKEELVQLRARFTEQYPDVSRVEQEIARLEGQPRSPAPTVNRSPGTSAAPDAPREPRTAVEAAESELQALANEEQVLKRQMAAYERRVENTPQREQEIKERSRDYGTTAELYYSLLKRYEDARFAESVERYQTGEQFRVLDSALPPTVPAAPNRPQLFALGCVLALAVAGAAVVIAEHLDTSFHSVDELRAFTRVFVLATIPPIVTPHDRARQRWRFGLAVAGMLGALTLTAVATHRLSAGNVQLVRLLARGKV